MTTTPIRLTPRFLKALLIAVMLGCLFGLMASRTHADDGCDPDNPTEVCLVVYHPGMCSWLEKYSPLWDFLGCRDEMEASAMLAEQTVDVQDVADVRVITVRRHYSDGTVREFYRLVPARRGEQR
jgi:hypothetical protein